MIDLNQVNTVVLLMFENRSFDHMLGHLSLENLKNGIDGLIPPLEKYENIYEGDPYNPFKIESDTLLPFDLPHEYDAVQTQLKKAINGTYSMSGFVEAYAQATKVAPNIESEPMGYFNSSQVPITSFLAKNYCTCNKWFSGLPTSTQPNRTIAFTGQSAIYQTKFQAIPSDNNIFKWMDDNGIRWRVYHDGISFFTFYPDLWPYLFSSHFREYKYLYRDMMTEAPDTAPQVIIIEPTYQDAPHIGSRPNDNHAPLAIGWGEDFLRRTYQSITANEEKWRNTVMVVYYDEHGGFYDHVPPPPIGYTTEGGDSHHFESLGPRIPGIVVSPFVQQDSVSNNQFDHTSVLQFLAECFTQGKIYSESVEKRRQQGIESLSVLLTNENYWAPPPAPSQPIDVKTPLGKSLVEPPESEMGKMFEAAAMDMLERKPSETAEKFPELLQWKDAVAKSRS